MFLHFLHFWGKLNDAQLQLKFNLLECLKVISDTLNYDLHVCSAFVMPRAGLWTLTQSVL